MASTGPRKRVKLTPPAADPQSTDGASPNRQRSSSRRNTWYPGAWTAGSKTSKAAPVTEVARESISMAKPASASMTGLDSPTRRQHPSLQLTKKASVSTRSLPADATTTRINIASDGSASIPAVEPQLDPTASPRETSQTADKEVSKDSGAIDPGKSEDAPLATAAPNATGDSDNPPTAETQPSGWLSWLCTPFVNAAPSESAAKPTSQPATSAGDLTTDNDGSAADSEPENQDRAPEDLEVSKDQSTLQKRSWFQMWYGSSSSEGFEVPKNDSARPEDGIRPDSDAPPRPKGNDEIPRTEDNYVGPTSASTKPSAWSFFFRDSSKDSTQAQLQDAEVVEASITQDTSTNQLASEPESKPERKTEITNKRNVKIKSPLNGSSTPDNVVPTLEAGSKAPGPVSSEVTASKHLQKIIPNQVLPQFRDTFALQDRPTLLQSISRFLHYSREPSNQHVYKTPHTSRIKKAVVIGVHGYFPAPLIRTVIGQPTGTSVRFSTMGAEAVRKYTEEHGYTCEIVKIALEGEGRIAERVDLLWKLLLNWMEEIRTADFILIACHSQGVPVGTMLLAKLISFGCINATRVGICAMAGVSLGPFSDYRSRWISGSAGELFEFALPYSQVSKDYESAVKTCLDFGARISYIGSIDDQLVSLESSLFSPASHPYIYRAVFVDGRVHAPSFVSHLVGFALKLRNLGFPDHGLIRELSSPLAGSLYTGDGHSRLYDDDAVYRLAIEFALETTQVPSATLQIKRTYPPPPANPYILPFAMRGLLEEEYVRNELRDETIGLLREFDDWKPTSKVLKDVKFRLEGIRSKL